MAAREVVAAETVSAEADHAVEAAATAAVVCEDQAEGKEEAEEVVAHRVVHVVVLSAD